jgi:hypothetical protein
MSRRGAADVLMILLVMLLLLTIGSGAYAYMIWDEAKTLERRLGQSEKDLKVAIDIRDDLREIKVSGQSAMDQETNTIQSFFVKTAQDHKFQIDKFTNTRGKYKEWDETAYRLEFKNVTRSQLGNFIADVQIKRPFLKSKEIREVRFDDLHTIKSVTVVFSHYQRAKK